MPMTCPYFPLKLCIQKEYKTRGENRVLGFIREMLSLLIILRCCLFKIILNFGLQMHALEIQNTVFKIHTHLISEYDCNIMLQKLKP